MLALITWYARPSDRVGRLTVLPWWVRWVSPGVTLCLGLAMLAFGNELWWRGAARSLARHPRRRRRRAGNAERVDQ
jgi:hypothetical protein